MATISEDYCDFEIAKLLKEKGFNGPCRTHYMVDTGLQRWTQNYGWNTSPLIVLCPTRAIVMKWLREVHNIHISITFGWVSGYNAQVDWAEESEKGNDKPACCVWRTDLNTTYEAAVEAAIKYSLENLI